MPNQDWKKHSYLRSSYRWGEKLLLSWNEGGLLPIPFKQMFSNVICLKFKHVA